MSGTSKKVESFFLASCRAVALTDRGVVESTETFSNGRVLPTVHEIVCLSLLCSCPTNPVCRIRRSQGLMVPKYNIANQPKDHSVDEAWCHLAVTFEFFDILLIKST